MHRLESLPSIHLVKNTQGSTPAKRKLKQKHRGEKKEKNWKLAKWNKEPVNS